MIAGQATSAVTLAISMLDASVLDNPSSMDCSRGQEANALRSQHNALVATGLSDKQARFRVQQALRGVARLQQVLLVKEIKREPFIATL